MAESTARRSFAIFHGLLAMAATAGNSAGFASSGNTNLNPSQRKHSGFLPLPEFAMN
jgi:hypothetical protein